MSRIGKLPINIPPIVTVTVAGSKLTVKGPKGELSLVCPREVKVEQSEDKVLVSIKSNTKLAQALHGTIRALLNNMVQGVQEGWSKKLEIVGTGYRAEVVDGDLILTVGFSHPVKIIKPEGIEFKVEKNVVTVEGVDKIAVGQISAKIRDVRPPEPYKGKGIAYQGEVIRRKAGKAAKTGAAA